MGVDTIHDFMAPFGFGQITGVDLGGEVRGVLPSTAWKRATYKRPETRRWYQGETVSLAGSGHPAPTVNGKLVNSITGTILMMRDV